MSMTMCCGVDDNVVILITDKKYCKYNAFSTQLLETMRNTIENAYDHVDALPSGPADT